MADFFTLQEIVQIALTGSAGLLGIGVGIGMFKGTLVQFKKDIAEIKKDIEIVRKRQAKLRGEDNGNTPVYMVRNDCIEVRRLCGQAGQDQVSSITRNIDAHTKNIKSLENFARWWMQKEGLAIHEINEILRNNQ